MRRTMLLAAAVAVLAVGMRLKTLRQIPEAAWFGTENERVAAALAQGHGFAEAYGAGTPAPHCQPAVTVSCRGERKFRVVLDQGLRSVRFNNHHGFYSRSGIRTPVYVLDVTRSVRKDRGVVWRVNFCVLAFPIGNKPT